MEGIDARDYDDSKKEANMMKKMRVNALKGRYEFIIIHKRVSQLQIKLNKTGLKVYSLSIKPDNKRETRGKLKRKKAK